MDTGFQSQRGVGPSHFLQGKALFKGGFGPFRQARHLIVGLRQLWGSAQISSNFQGGSKPWGVFPGHHWVPKGGFNTTPLCFLSQGPFQALWGAQSTRPAGQPISLTFHKGFTFPSQFSGGRAPEGKHLSPDFNSWPFPGIFLKAIGGLWGFTTRNGLYPSFKATGQTSLFNRSFQQRSTHLYIWGALTLRGLATPNFFPNKFPPRPRGFAHSFVPTANFPHTKGGFFNPSACNSRGVHIKGGGTFHQRAFLHCPPTLVHKPDQGQPPPFLMGQISHVVSHIYSPDA